MISFNNIPGDLRVPLFYAEMDPSYANNGSTQLRRLIIAQANDGAQIEPGLRIASQTSEVIALAGAGSPLAMMHKVWRANDPMGEVWILPVFIETGQAALGTLSIVGSAGEAGVLALYVGAQRVQITVAASMTAADVADAVAVAVNNAQLPVMAESSDSLVTFTARFKGLLGNDIQLGANLRGSAGGERTPAGLVLQFSEMAGGAGVPDFAEILSLIGDEPFEFVCHAFTDSASLGDLREWLNDVSGRWAWSKKLYGHAYAAKRGTLGELVALGRNRNDQHSTVYGFERMVPNPAWEVAAAYGARQAVFISADPARPTQTGPLVGIMPAPEGKRFMLVERQSLLWAGTATAYLGGEYMRIERAVTTYQKNDWNQPDDSYLDSETMHQSAYILRFLESRITSKYGRHKLADDGTRFGEGQAIVTPSVIRGELIAAYSELEHRGLVENMTAFQKHLIVERDSSNPSRMNVLFPPDYINQLRVFALLNQFRLQYQVEPT